jgi:hypothetical protein
MNVPLPLYFDQSAVANTLRDLACSWLQSLRDTVSAFATIEVPYPNYPLPQGFPFCGTVFRERFRWVDVIDDNLRQINQSYYVRLELHAPHDLSSSVAWSLTSREELNLSLLALDLISNFVGNVVLGYVYFDRRIYEELPGGLGSNVDLVLLAMMRSLNRRNAVVVMSTVIAAVFPDQNRLPNIETFVGLTVCGTFSFQLGSRRVPARRCTLCDIWIPPSGADCCYEHLIS